MGLDGIGPNVYRKRISEKYSSFFGGGWLKA